jgi:EmrB/QacA subfamily drug resistance transporter
LRFWSIAVTHDQMSRPGGAVEGPADAPGDHYVRTAHDRTGRMTRRQVLALVLLAGTQLMLVLDVTVVNVALPDLARSLSLGQGTVPWVMTTYTLLFGGLVLLGGRVADLLGARRMLVAGLSVFTAASLACAVADQGAVLLVGRAVQGVGAALLSPAALAVVTATYSGAARAKALAVWGSLSAVGTALGVSLGGLVTSALGWQWIFAINVPIGLTILTVLPMVTGPSPRARSGRLDVPGAALVTAGTGSVVFGLAHAGDHGWTSSGTVLALLAGVALWLVFAVQEHRATNPLLRLDLLGEPSVAVAVALMVLATGLMIGDFFVGSFVLQRVFGDSPLRVGLEFLPVAALVGAGAQAAGHLLLRLSTRPIAAGGLALAAAGETAAALDHGDRIPLVAGLAVASLGIGAVFVTAFTAALAAADPAEAGLRSAAVSTAHELGGAFGVAVLSSLAGAALTVAHPTFEDFTSPFTAAAAAAAVGAVLAAAFTPSARKPSRPAGHTDHHHP